MKKILVIEDDRIMRENMAELLELTGYEVEVAENGKEGVETARKVLPDLIICDVKMPRLDGYGVLHILSNEPETASIPFIFVTARTERSDRRRGMELGADDYLTKPFEDTELIQAVEARLKKSTLTPREEQAPPEIIRPFLSKQDQPLEEDAIPGDWQRQDYEARTLIFRADDYPHYVYYVREGRVKTYRLNRDGKELISHIYRTGDFFSYQPVLEDRRYKENAEAMEACQIYQIPKESFLELIGSSPEIAAKLIKVISKSLSGKEEDLMHMAYDSVRKRLALKLLELTAEKDGNTISFLRTDLAAMTGTTTETIVRTLTEFKDEGILETDGQEIRLIDRKALKRLSEKW
jgi:CRP-like cAMP-binding protein/CheY-like chemotaxis protein